ncbi:hypothetical protein [Paraburkholderia sacchari]|uniref:hypothetical protein n=1 Tax=Paraburkholderia sacchari TaxID=159450 RepID=UPI001FD2A698|nr:hypothetical protein [Paraburkholderia sacchari]
MSLIVASRFTTFDHAEAAIDKLHDHGFVDEDLSLFYVNPGGQHARFPVGGDRYADPQSRWASLGAGAGGGPGALAAFDHNAQRARGFRRQRERAAR